MGRKTGRAELDEHALGVNTSEIEAPFVLDKRSKDEVLAEIREKIKVIPGVNIEIGTPITHRINAMLSGSRVNIAIKLFGTDLNRMYEIGNQIKNSIQNIEGVADLNVEQQVERPQLKIEPKREMLAKYGVTLPQFADIVNVMLGGEAVSQVYEENKSFDLTLKVNDSSRENAERIRKLIVDANGRKVSLENIANVVSSMGPNTISRENVARKLVISANVADRDLRGVVNDIQKKVDSDRMLGIQFDTLFEDDLYMKIGASAIAAADQIRDTLTKCGYRLFLDSPTNQVFIVMENEAAAQLARKAEITLWEKYDDTHTMVRFVTDWATQQRDVDMLVEILEQECNPTLACVS